MSTMVERVTLAIAKTKPTTRVGYNEYGQHVEIDYGPVARAAIEALMEPTDTMVKAGSEQFCQDYEAPLIWASMIQAALKEQA